MPDFSLEASLKGAVAGIDEAGRGPWAGPVVAAAVVLDPLTMPAELMAGLDDSKKLGKPVRERLFDMITAHAAAGVGQASVEEIDSLNILQATMLAMRRAVDDLPVRPQHAIVDGNRIPDLGIPTRCIVRGDAKALSIAAASIVAKVTRDRLMARLDAEFPGFGWASNAGYGTKQHAVALERHGVTRHHRKSFAPVAKLIK
jgi:ribonuclease HII